MDGEDSGHELRAERSLKSAAEHSARVASFVSLVVAGALVCSCSDSHSGTKPDGGSKGESGHASATGGRNATGGNGGAGGARDAGGKDAGGAHAGASAGHDASMAAGSDATGPAMGMHPERPAWMPPFDLGAPGWRDSRMPLCARVHGTFAGHAVYSTAKGVYALLSDECNPLAETGCVEAESGLELYFNSGSGWESQHFNATGSSNVGLSGLPGGAALVYGDTCGVSRIDGGKASCVLDGAGIVSDAFGVRDDLAYAARDMTVYRYDGTAFSKLADLEFAPEALWADGSDLYAVGFNQAIAHKHGDATFEMLPNVPAGDYVSVFAFAADDVWAGNRVGQLVHYDGKTFKVIETGATEQGDGIRRIWGADGKLFFFTSKELGRWDGSKVEWLLSPSDRIMISDIWGNSPSELFIAIEDSDYTKYDCGGQSFMLRWDGTTFHQF